MLMNTLGALAPCMLILEDVETIVTPQTRSYFFNEMDGLENNDGLFIVASTNFLDRLDPGLSKRPSRFDRKYLFPLPNEHERTLYCEFWRQKLAKNKDIEFPKKLTPAMAHITPGFSFAFLQECFVATLLIMARQEEDLSETLKEDHDLNEYELWRVFKSQADILRKEVDGSASQSNWAPGVVNGMLGQQISPGLDTEPSDGYRVLRQPSATELQMKAEIPDLTALQIKEKTLPALYRKLTPALDCAKH